MDSSKGMGYLLLRLSSSNESATKHVPYQPTSTFPDGPEHTRRKEAEKTSKRIKGRCLDTIYNETVEMDKLYFEDAICCSLKLLVPLLLRTPQIES